MAWGDSRRHVQVLREGKLTKNTTESSEDVMILVTVLCTQGTQSFKSLSYIWLFATPWIIAFQAPLSMELIQTKILEPVAILFAGGIFPAQGSNLGPTLQAGS